MVRMKHYFPGNIYIFVKNEWIGTRLRGIYGENL